MVLETTSLPLDQSPRRRAIVDTAGRPNSQVPCAPRGRGGIGRHAGLRSRCRKAWGFESLRPHPGSIRTTIRDRRGRALRGRRCRLDAAVQVDEQPEERARGLAVTRARSPSARLTEPTSSAGVSPGTNSATLTGKSPWSSSSCAVTGASVISPMSPMISTLVSGATARRPRRRAALRAPPARRAGSRAVTTHAGECRVPRFNVSSPRAAQYAAAAEEAEDTGTLDAADPRRRRGPRDRRAEPRHRRDSVEAVQ